jgi:hypothetical protein
LTEPGLATLLVRELKFLGAIGAKAQATKLHLRNYDLVVLPDAVIKSPNVAPRLALHVLRSPVFGRGSIGAGQIARLASAARNKADGIVAAIAGETFARREFLPWLKRELAARGLTLGDAGGAMHPLWLIAVDEAYYFGLPTFNYHALRKRAAEREGSLPPTIAAAMAFAAKLGLNEIVWDPVAGSGTVLSEVAAFAPDAALLGTDVDQEALAAARKNLALLANLRLLRASAETAELGTRALTLTIGNLPFGKQHKAEGGNVALYEAILRRSLAQAAPSWRACLLTSDETAMDEALARIDGLEANKAAELRVRGLAATIWLIERK